MTTICTSCGVPIPSSLSTYKCRQCINHFVCQLCETKNHNRASAPFHTLDKIQVPTVQPSAAATNSKPPILANDLRKNQTKTSPKSSSIFNSEEYLYSVLGYCAHCCRLVAVDKDPTFQCQQCPDGFGVCAQCMPLMATHHPSQHIFSQKPLSHWAKVAHDMYHMDITCDGCSLKGFNGKRYQCEECSPSYDLCENCFGKKHTHHKLKYIQNPLLHSYNQSGLGRRILAIVKKNTGINPDWRDPITGWTKSDAELVVQQAKTEQGNYEKRMEENNQLLQVQLADSQRRLQDTIDDGWRRTLWNMTLH